MSVLGIDPGSTGAAVYITDKMRSIAFLRFKNSDPSMFLHWLVNHPLSHGSSVLLENVHAWTADKKSLSRLATFMQNVGGIKWLLHVSGNGYTEIEPAVWQREFGLGGLSKPERKKKAVQIAQALFPSIKVTTDLGDAILIAEYAWRKTYGELTHGRDKNKEPRKGAGIIWKNETDSVV